MEDSNQKQQGSFFDDIIGFIMTKASAFGQTVSPEVKEKIGDGAGRLGSASATELGRSVQQTPQTPQIQPTPQVQPTATVQSGVGATSSAVGRNVMSLIEPGSPYLMPDVDGDSYILMTIKYASAVELAEAGRLVAGYRATHSEYYGLGHWIARNMKGFTSEQIEQLETRVKSNGADLLLDNLHSLLSKLDSANWGKGGKWEQDLAGKKPLNPNQQQKADAIAVASSELNEFIEQHGSHFAHVLVDGVTIRESLHAAMKTNDCNNDWAKKVRNALTTQYKKLPAFVEVWHKLQESGYFANSGEGL